MKQGEEPATLLRKISVGPVVGSIRGLLKTRTRAPESRTKREQVVPIRGALGGMAAVVVNAILGTVDRVFDEEPRVIDHGAVEVDRHERIAMVGAP